MALDTSDYSGNSNDLTNNNSVAEETSDTPNANITVAANFTRTSSQTLSIADASQTGLDLSSTGTIEFWFKPKVTNVFCFPFTKWDGAGNTGGYQVYFNNTESVFYTYNTDYGWSTFSSLLQTGWHHYAYVVDTSNALATQFEVYRDGVSVGNGTTAGVDEAAIADTSAAFYIGGRNDGSTIDGYIADFRVWNDVRTSTEISNNYQNHLSSPTSEANLVAYYPFKSLADNTLRINEGPGIYVV